MKSRTSFFNFTVFRKDITRFFPAWLLYGIAVMIEVNSLSSVPAWYRANSVAGSICTFVTANLLYAPIVVSLLFGDLFKRRLCNGIHALPLRRETLFCTHLVSGLLFSLIPNCVYFLFALISLGSCWYMAMFWLLAVTMSYLCFFGIAVFSANCTGNRFAMFCVYAGIVFLPMILYYIYYTLFQPLLYGISIDSRAFIRFSPVNMSVLSLMDLRTMGSGKVLHYTADWLWYAGFLAEGLVLEAAGLLLYRKRQMETAGDFLSAKIFLPVVLVLCPICIALVLLSFFGLFGSDMSLLLLVPALVLGVILTQMLLRRSTRVFGKSTWVTSALLVGALGVALLLTALDPIGITTRTPQPEEVACVTVSKYGDVGSGSHSFVRCTEAGEIEKVISLHKSVIQEKEPIQEAVYADGIYSAYVIDGSDKVPLRLDYTLKSGRKVHREYWLSVDSAVGEAYGQILGSPEYVLSTLDYRDWDSFCQSVYAISILDNTIADEDLPAALETLKADFDAGNLNQAYGYHAPSYDTAWLEIITKSGSMSLTLWPDDSLTYRWLVDNGYYTPEELYR